VRWVLVDVAAVFGTNEGVISFAALLRANHGSLSDYHNEPWGSDCDAIVNHWWASVPGRIDSAHAWNKSEQEKS
jgi:hypothetical protein